jgi:hypothetical protein
LTHVIKALDFFIKKNHDFFYFSIFFMYLNILSGSLQFILRYCYSWFCINVPWQIGI